MRSAIFALVVGGVVALGGSGASSAADCISLARFSHARFLADGAAISVHIGALIEVELVERALPSGYPTSFPWLTPVSTDRRVLVAVPLCKHRVTASSLDTSITLFRAVRAGRVSVAARVAPAWQTVKVESWPRPFSARVSVAR